MKLYLLILISILLFSIIQTYREGLLSEPTKEYGGVLAIQQQITALDDILNKIKRIPVYETDVNKRNVMIQNITLVRDGMQIWLTNRISYMNINNNTPFPPSENQSMDGLRDRWNDNGIGYKTLIDATMERLDISKDIQRDIADSLNRFVDNMHSELNISVTTD